MMAVPATFDLSVVYLTTGALSSIPSSAGRNFINEPCRFAGHDFNLPGGFG
jgi:hypothetical protein